MRLGGFVLVALALFAACGHSGPPGASTDAGDAGAAQPAADAASPGDGASHGDGAMSSAGTCTYIDQPGWLSCPTGMSCQCYYDYDKLFENQPATLDVQLTGAALAITGGSIPANDTLDGVTAASVPLSPDGTGGQTGSTYPYQVTVSPAGAMTITIYALSGYVPASDVLYTDADCGNQGKILQCSFAE